MLTPLDGTAALGQHKTTLANSEPTRYGVQAVMAFSMSQASQGGGKKDKLPKLQANADKTDRDYVATVVDVKQKMTNSYGEAFILEFVIDSGERAGEQHDFMVTPDNVRPGGRMPLDEKKRREYGKIQRAVAACYGLPETRAFEVDDDKYAAAIARPVSPLRGRKIVVRAVYHEGEKGPTTYYEILPFQGAANTNTIQAATKAAIPPIVKPGKTFAQAAAAAGFVVHPEDADFYYSDATEEVVAKADLQKQLGY